MGMKHLSKFFLVVFLLILISVSWAMVDRAAAEFNVWNTERIRKARADPALFPLRGKVWLGRIDTTPILYFSNASRPTARERQAIKKLYERRSGDRQWLLDWARKLNLPYEDMIISLTTAKQSLLIDLYDGRLTYGQHTRMSREVSNKFVWENWVVWPY